MRSAFIEALAHTRLYPLTDRGLSGLSLAEQVSILCDGGVRIIQLREKKLSARQFYSEAAQALVIARQHSVKIIINDRVDIALALGADGVHLGQDDLDPTAARRLLGNKAIVGFSTHNLEQVRLASRLPVNYVALGPIFETSTKQNPDPTLGLENVGAAKQILGEIPLVAIGGITQENGQLVLESGADALAVIGAIWHAASDPLASIQNLVSNFGLSRL